MENIIKKYNLGVKQRLSMGFGLLLGLIGLLTLIGMVIIFVMNSNLSHVMNVNTIMQKHAVDMRGSVHDRAIGVRDMTLIMPGENRALNEVVELTDDLEAAYTISRKNLEEINNSNAITSQERALVDTIDKIEKTTMAYFTEVKNDRLNNNISSARTILMSDAAPGFVNWLNAINAYLAFQESSIKSQIDGVQNTAKAFLVIMLILCVLAFAIGYVVSKVIVASLLNELGAEPVVVKQYAEDVGNGRLFRHPDHESSDTVSILSALVTMTQKLQKSVRSVRESAETVSSTTDSIAEGNLELAARTEQQSSALTETATAMEELGSTVKHNSESASEADKLAVRASDVAGKGGEVMSEVVNTMNEISDRSKKMADIISVINGIAFQTNILALNASVEAARAGEHGRGFSVVATEVRNLSQRTTQAAKDIAELISENVDQVDKGTKLVGVAGKTTQDIVDEIKKVSFLMTEISNASVEQSTGVEQVGMAIAQMDQATQQNSAMVSESAGIVKELNDQAKQLLEVMAIFQIEGEVTRSKTSRKGIDAKRLSSPKGQDEWTDF